MGRVEPSIGRPPATIRKQQRAKRAKETSSKVIPALLGSNTRARDGVTNAELIVDPPAFIQGNLEARARANTTSHGKKSKGTRRKNNQDDDPIVASGPYAAVGVDEIKYSCPPNVKVMVTDTLTAAATLNRSPRSSARAKKSTAATNVAILNMASLLRPGGGFLNGATSQEEFLCMRTTLLPSLREDFYRLPEIGGIWTPDVLVFRDPTSDANDLPHTERYHVNVLTSGMMRFPNIITRTSFRGSDGEITDQRVEEQYYASKADSRLARHKIRAVLRILERKGCKRVVLGAWGCGAYGNPVAEIARAWKETLLGMTESEPSKHGPKKPLNEERFGLEEVVFAISQRKMAADFARLWGDDVTMDSVEPKSLGSHDEEHNEEQAELEDLRSKVAQLQEQVQNAKTPMLKAGLGSVLQKLERELKDKTSLAFLAADSSASDLAIEDEADGSASDAEI